jgi:chorismate synthase
MTELRFLTAGESHGGQLTAIVEGVPAGLGVSAAAIDRDLVRRQGGFGRGARQQIESDSVRIVGGVRYGRTTGAPVALVVPNRDAGNWGEARAVEAVEAPAAAVRVPRPGHADLMGHLEYGLGDLRDVIERASARETAARVACGAVARALLDEIGCSVVSHVCAIGDVTAAVSASLEGCRACDADPVRCLDPEASEAMCEAIVKAGQDGDTLGGVFEVIAYGYPAGVGSYVQGDRRLGSLLAAAALSIPAMKGVEIGDGFAAAAERGSQVHDEIVLDDGVFGRRTNRAGGIEGGISTGEPIVVRVAMKPIATLLEPLQSVDLDSGEATASRFERSDVCAVPAASVVGEAVVALTLASAALERFGGAAVSEFASAVGAFRERIRRR